MKKMYVYCDGGFGNRFNVLISGLYLAEKIGAIPIIIWNTNNWCGASFNQIFDMKCQVIDNFKKESFFKEKNLCLILHENQFAQPLEYTSPFSFTNTEQIKSHVGDEDVFYFTNLIPSWVDDLSIVTKIKFNKHLEDTVDSIRKQFNYISYCGVHIRKTDFYETLNEQEIYSLIQNDIQTLYFVCSDDRETEMKFLTLPNVFVYSKTSYVEKLNGSGEWNSWITDNNGNQFPFNVNRNSSSVVQAIVDLLLLSYSEILNKNSSSTFLKTAMLLKKFRLK
jgi:hypothetical protein